MYAFYVVFLLIELIHAGKTEKKNENLSYYYEIYVNMYLQLLISSLTPNKTRY